MKRAKERGAAIALKRPTSAPATEWSEEFLQAMVNRMATAFHSYGKAAEAYPGKVDAVGGDLPDQLGSMGDRLARYKLTGNTEWLVDVANFAMLEFMHPRHPEAHFRPTDAVESPGRKWRGERDPSRRGNREP